MTRDISRVRARTLRKNVNFKRWMLFVDGENFTIRSQQYAKEKKINIKDGECYCCDVFIWMPDTSAIKAFTAELNVYGGLQSEAIRSYYYTSFTGDDKKGETIKKALWDLGFQANVFKKERKEVKAKGVDIALSKDLLSHAFHDHYDVAVLIAGDGDYLPLIEEVKRHGKIVYLSFFSDEGNFKSGLNQELKIASDEFFDLNRTFRQTWAEWIQNKLQKE